MAFDVAPLKTYYKAKIDAAAARLMPAFNVVHAPKLEEARDVIDQMDDEKSAKAVRAMKAKAIKDTYPLLAASIGIDGDTLEQVALKVQARAMSSRNYATVVERTRLLSKAAIDESKSKDECEAAFLAITWPKVKNE